MTSARMQKPECVCCETANCDILEQEINHFTEENIKNLAMIGLDFIKTQKGGTQVGSKAQLSQSDIHYFKNALLSKYGSQISKIADEKTRQAHPKLEPGSTEYAAMKRHEIAKLINYSFQKFTKPPGNWTSDHSYFFNRRTEQGFNSKQQTAEKLSGLFGDLLYDIVYPKWWGGQKGSWIYDQTFSQGVTTKVNNQPASVYTQPVGQYNKIPTWHQHYHPGALEISHEDVHRQTENQRPSTATQKIDPIDLTPAGVGTVGKGSQFNINTLQLQGHIPQREGNDRQLIHNIPAQNRQQITAKFAPMNPSYSPYLQPGDYQKVPLDQLYTNQQRHTTSLGGGENRYVPRPTDTSELKHTAPERSAEDSSALHNQSNPYIPGGTVRSSNEDRPQEGELPREFPHLPGELPHLPAAPPVQHNGTQHHAWQAQHDLPNSRIELTQTHITTSDKWRNSINILIRGTDLTEKQTHQTKRLPNQTDLHREVWLPSRKRTTRW